MTFQWLNYTELWLINKKDKKGDQKALLYSTRRFLELNDLPIK